MSPTSVPRLLYHDLAPTLYPSNSDESVLTIRFSSPVRIESIRIIPEGVNSLTGIGSTYPNQFNARVLFNISPSNPVNALSTANIVYDGNKAWDQDYRIGMPEGVSTRMMVIVGKIDRLSISVYGYRSDMLGMDENLEEETAHDGMEREDWSWISKWAGGVDGLMRLLDGKVSSLERGRAIESLELLGLVDPDIYDQMVRHPSSVAYLQTLSTSDPSPLLRRLCDVPKYALHSSLRHHLPEGHRYQSLVIGSEELRREAAWSLLPDEGAMHILQELGPGDWIQRDRANRRSRRSILIGTLEGWTGSQGGYEDGLDLLLSGIGENWSSSLARKVTPLLVKSRMQNSSRMIGIPLSYTQEVITALIDVPPSIDGQTTLPTVTSLADPYLRNIPPSHPLQKAFTPTALAGHQGQTPSERAVSRFIQSLQSPNNGYTHSLTPEQLLSALAPDLLHSLPTARQPMFGLVHARGPTHSQTLASASTFAGKVYSSHDFRSRQVTAESTTAGSMVGGLGLGVSGVRGESRPASRHVDDYVTSR